MNQDHFVNEHQALWRNFELWLDAQAKRQAAEPPLEAAEIPHLYRRLCQHLAIARTRQYSAHIVDYLNDLVLRGHQYLYTPLHASRGRYLAFIVADFPNLIRREWRLFLLASVLFYLPLFGMALAIQFSPDIAFSVLSPAEAASYRDMYDPQADHLGARQVDDDILMFGFYIYNNISIGFRTFASGIVFGIGSAFTLLFNGVVIGAVAGHLIEYGYDRTFLGFVAGHSALELTAIVIAGSAGLKLGFALLSPGQYTRMQALRRAGAVSIRLIYGVILMLTLAALIEAFWSSRAAIAPGVKYAVGIALWALVISYLLFAGRRRAS